jgi:hypothetical protein
LSGARASALPPSTMPMVRPCSDELDQAFDDPDGAFIGVAFLEEQAAARSFA